MSSPDPTQSLRIAESPAQDRPRERLLASGVETLRLADLLAILIRSGRPGESAIQAGEKLAAKYHDQLAELPLAAPAELKDISAAVAKTAYCQIMAGVELGRRVAEARQSQEAPTRITSSQIARQFCERHFQRLAQDGCREELHIVSLDTKHQVLTTHQISVGTLDASLVHPREIFRPAIKDAAAAILLVHNHPSGDPTPSREDHAVTRRIEEVGKLLGIELLDHIVLGDACSQSVRDQRGRC